MWGLNTVLMGVIPGVLVYSVIKQFARKHSEKLAVRAAGSWAGTFIAALVCGLCMFTREEAREHAGTWMASMLGVHAIIGLVEAAITVTLLAAVAKIAMLNWSNLTQTIVSLLAMSGVVIWAAQPRIGASPYPDGLEYNLERIGIEALPNFAQAFENTFAPWPDYESLIGTLAGNVILLVVAAAGVFVLSSLTSKKVSD
jgi:cobalt/nickel transport system permease protein